MATTNYTFPVNGEAQIQTNTGSGKALEAYGISVDGITITLSRKWKDIFIDTTGDEMPADKIDKGVRVYIRTQMIKYDPGVHSRIMQRNFWNGATEGTLGAVGRLLLQNTLQTNLVVLSPVFNVPLNFENCHIVEDYTLPLAATEIMIPDYKWEALWTPQLATTLGSVFWNNSPGSLGP